MPDKHLLTMHRGFMHLGAGLSVGLSGLAAGYAIGIVGDMVRASVYVIESIG